MTAKEMQIQYWKRELKDAERGIDMSDEGSEQLALYQKRYGYAERKLKELGVRPGERNE